MAGFYLEEVMQGCLLPGGGDAGQASYYLEEDMQGWLLPG
jgi:hypothetical protein